MLTASSSVDASEVAKFARLAEHWWDPEGSFAPLHRFNPIRLKLIRDTAAAHFGRDIRKSQPFRGLSLLDLGCGGGLLSEPLAGVGFQVLGCDPAEENIGIAAAHASHTAAPVSYRVATIETLRAEQLTFDVVLAMEIIEHVPDVATFLRASAELVRPDGLIFVATINKTLKSLALAKIAAEYLLRWVPAGTHDWNRFVTPETLHEILVTAGFEDVRTQGISFDPLRWRWELSNDPHVNYVVIGRR